VIGWGVMALQLLLGWHAHDLRRWRLGRRGWALAHVVAAADAEAALLRAMAEAPRLIGGRPA
jgi:hypothetical protein